MEEYKKLAKYLEKFCKKTGLQYNLDLAANPEADENKLEEIKEYLKTIK